MSDFILDDPRDLYLQSLDELLEEYYDDDDMEMRGDRYELMAQRHHAWQILFSRLDYQHLQFSAMLTQRDFESHEDYESFAHYLGIDYDTYYEMMIGADDTEDSIMVGISNSSNDTK